VNRIGFEKKIVWEILLGSKKLQNLFEAKIDMHVAVE